LRVQIGQIALANKTSEIAVNVLAGHDRGKGLEQFGKVGVLALIFHKLPPLNSNDVQRRLGDSLG